MIKKLLALQRLDKLLLSAIFLLAIFSLVTIYSLTFGLDNAGLVFWKQLIGMLIGFALFFYFSAKNYNSWRRFGWFFYLSSLVLLVGVLLFGQEIRNIKAWFVIGPVSFQPIEIVKVMVIIFLADFFASWKGIGSIWWRISLSAILVGVLAFLTLQQPDWGSALILLSIWGVMILFLPVKRWQIFTLAVIAIGLAVFSFFFVLQDYQRDRIINFINPAYDPLGSGYQSTQVKVAIGSGGLWGKGFGRGTQAQLKFLPEAQTDFIYAVVAEEFGFVGAVIVLLLFLFICYRSLQAAKIARTDFGSLLALGVTVFLLVQITVNIGMNLGLLPITGVPLPLLSAGGSSLLSVFISLGIVNSIYIHDR